MPSHQSRNPGGVSWEAFLFSHHPFQAPSAEIMNITRIVKMVFKDLRPVPDQGPRVSSVVLIDNRKFIVKMVRMIRILGMSRMISGRLHTAHYSIVLLPILVHTLFNPKQV
jgi:hypothetical protein